MSNQIRTLRADEIEVRVQQVKKNGCILFPYKDARCDMKILDETYTPFGWKRSHEEVNGNVYCTVSIKNEGEWISKSDAGVGGNTEKEKAEASDSFKRACVNWGIGRELYSAPFIWVPLEENETVDGKKLVYGLDFSVKEVSYNNDRMITKLIIVDNFGKTRYVFDPENTIGKAECVKLIDNAKSIEELKSIWSSYKIFQKDAKIIEAKDKKKAELDKSTETDEVKNEVKNKFSKALKDVVSS